MALALAGVGVCAGRAQTTGPIVYPASERPDAPLVIFYSGDGGWAGADRAICSGLARRGLPVVGVDSLHYFLRHRSAEAAARDLGQLIDRYSDAWRTRGVVLAGYSFGGAALPFIVQKLPPDVAGQIRLVALLAPTRKGELVLRPWSWLDIPGPGARPIEPALAAVSSRVICIYGARDRAAACSRLDPQHVASLELGTGHHFSRRYDAAAQDIAQAAAAAP